jgi:hypothetical protein
VAALEARRIKKQSVSGFFPTRPEPNTTVVVQAAGEDDAIRRVRDALEGHGDFSGFEAEPFVDLT